jgi:putative effector of murein hydrolase
VAAGIAIGSSGHAVGTSTAIKLGPVQGATSGIAIGLSGLFTVLIYSILFRV